MCSLRAELGLDDDAVRYAEIDLLSQLKISLAESEAGRAAQALEVSPCTIRTENCSECIFSSLSALLCRVGMCS